VESIAEFAFYPLRFNRDAELVAPEERAAILAAAQNFDDLIVLAHGWNNDMDEAKNSLFAPLLQSLRGLLPSRTELADRRIGCVGVFWPSKRFADAELIPGGAAALNAVDDLAPLFDALLTDFFPGDGRIFDAPDANAKLTAAKALLPQLESSTEAQLRFAELLRGLLAGIHADASPAADDEGLQAALRLGPQGLLDRLRTNWDVLSEPQAGAPAAEGGALGLGGVVTSVRDAARRALNFVTYYQMRERAAVVGRRGLHQQLLRPLQGVDGPGERRLTPLLHLVGHSFGGRLVTAAADGPQAAGVADASPPVRIASLCLLQAAFSHFGFADRWDGVHNGLFRRVLTDHRVAGPVVVTYSPHDRAVGMAYPIASALAGQIATALGDASDRFGGIGRNGALKAPESVNLVMGPATQTYPPLMAGRIYNLDASTQIRDHGDVRSPPVANVVLAAFAGGVEASHPTPPDQDEDDAGGGATSVSASPFDPRKFARSVIAAPLIERIKRDPARPQRVVMDLNLDFPGGVAEAKRKIQLLLSRLDPPSRIAELPQYDIGTITGQSLVQLVQDDGGNELSSDGLRPCPSGKEAPRAIFRVWPDFKVRALTIRSAATVKADAARLAFSAVGKDVIWAVMDSGIDEKHRHFVLRHNIHSAEGNTSRGYHRDFTAGPAVPGAPVLTPEQSAASALMDRLGHGTHVAGIIAGEQRLSPESPCFGIRRRAPTSLQGGDGQAYDRIPITAISGMAPECTLVSLKVLDDAGNGTTGAILEAIQYIQELNGYGRRLVIHGANLSLGYNFDPDWFACGQSPLCMEIDRLVRSGVSVVVAAGNSGYGRIAPTSGVVRSAGIQLTINDPGNADRAITVGSTHREMPHIYGVSYFSSKGPTGDGRLKPDLLAPGERILSCAAGAKLREAIDASNISGDYIEDSGTSMAAPHVSGVIAAFLSIRQEFIGRPEEVKRIFCSTATDLGRERYFQGNGLVDLMRAIQAV
jgi:serine protease AprX